MKAGKVMGGTTTEPAKWTLRSIEEALSECQREVQVRERCYDGWITAGKLSTVDARDRMERAKSAVHYLKDLFETFEAKIDGNPVPQT